MPPSPRIALFGSQPPAEGSSDTQLGPFLSVFRTGIAQNRINKGHGAQTLVQGRVGWGLFALVSEV